MAIWSSAKRRVSGRFVRTILLTLGLTLPIACERGAESLADGGDPLRALRAPIESRVYDLAFWARQEIFRNPLWRTAFAFCACHDERRYPNCRSVRLASWWASPPPFPGPPSPPQPNPVSAARPTTTGGQPR